MVKPGDFPKEIQECPFDINFPCEHVDCCDAVLGLPSDCPHAVRKMR